MLIMWLPLATETIYPLRIIKASLILVPIIYLSWEQFKPPSNLIYIFLGSSFSPTCVFLLISQQDCKNWHTEVDGSNRGGGAKAKRPKHILVMISSKNCQSSQSIPTFIPKYTRVTGGEMGLKEEYLL